MLHDTVGLGHCQQLRLKSVMRTDNLLGGSYIIRLFANVEPSEMIRQ